MTPSKTIAFFSIGMVLLLATITSAQDLESGLITHFKFDETSGNYAYDSSDSGFDSQVLGGTEWGNGIIDGAIEFNGLDAKIDLGQPDEYTMTSFSIACWFKNDNADRFRVITARNSHWQTRQWWLTVWEEGYGTGRDAKLVFRMSPTSGNYVDLVSASRVDDDEWHSAVVTIDSTDGGTARLYLDNELQHTITGFGVPKMPNASAFIGRDISGSNRFYSGSLDDFRIYNRVLSADEIALISEQSPPPVFYVRTRGSDSNDGLSPGSSYRTIQKAISMCTRAGSTVYVGPGTYKESISIGTGNGSTAVSGTESSPTRIVADTTGSHTNDDPGTVLLDGQDSRADGIHLETVTDWTLEGLTIRNFASYGIRMPSGSMNILGCTIEVPQSYGVYSFPTADITIADTVFERDSRSAHVLWVQPNNTTNPVSVTVTRNDATMKGDLYRSTGFEQGLSSIKGRSSYNRYVYGIIVYGWNNGTDSIEITNNQISDCYLSIYGGLIKSDGNLTISNNTVTGSLFSTYAYSYSSGLMTITNNIIESAYYGGLVYQRNNQNPVYGGLIEHNILFDMSRMRRPFESIIINESPRFADAESGDFSLLFGSPGIDAGVSLAGLTVDIAGNSRPTDGDNDGLAQIDIGAYEQIPEPTGVRVVRWREIGIDSDR